MANARQTKKDEMQIVTPIKQYIDEGNKELMEFMQEFKAGTLQWRTDIEQKIITLLDMKKDIERLKIDNESLMAFRDEVQTQIKYMQWTYKGLAFIGSAFVAFVAFSEKIRILFFK